MYFRQPVPFYMAYPYTGFYDDEQTAQKDLDLMKSFYPDASAKIQQLVEARCDRMEYDGSMLYDEYPDNFMMEHICHQIRQELEKDKEVDPMLLESQECCPPKTAPVDELIRVLFCHEMFQRRCRHRRRRRYF